MLTACDANGKLIALIGPDAREKAGLLKKTLLFCPQCKNPVAVKAGSVNAPHFAHFSSLDCASFSERESVRHLTGKTDLYNWIAPYTSARLEACLPGSLQRPDILAGNVAVEFQCSVISTDLFARRSENYAERGLIPLWIYGGAPIKQKEKWLKFNPFHRLFFRFHKAIGFHMTCYDPDRKTFIVYTNIVPVTPSCCAASVHIIPVSRMPFPPQAALASASLSFEEAAKAQKRWISMSLLHSRSRHHPFFKAVYESGHMPLLLPEIIGLPLASAAAFASHPAEWQFYIWLDRHRFAPEETIRRRLKLGHLKTQPLPLAQNVSIEQAIAEYKDVIQQVEAVYHEPSLSVLEKQTKEKAFFEQYAKLSGKKRMFWKKTKRNI